MSQIPEKDPEPLINAKFVKWMCPECFRCWFTTTEAKAHICPFCRHADPDPEGEYELRFLPL